MDNIDVLLKAAEFIESQKCIGEAQNHLNVDSSLSPISSVSYSSSSSSLFNSPNNSNNLMQVKNDPIYPKKINKQNQNSTADKSSNIYSSSLPSHFVSSPLAIMKNRKNDETTSAINKSMSRLEEMKRDKAIHNTLEKNRRAHLKGCFESLQSELPQYKDKKCTNLAILNYTLKFIEQCKRKDKENELEKKRILEEQFRLKKNLRELALDFKSKYLQLNTNSIDDANSKFIALLQSLNIDPDLCIKNDKAELINSKIEDQEIDFDQKMNSYSTNATSPKQIVAKYYRKRSSNSLSMITGIKTIQATQSLQLQLQNQLKLQKAGKRLNGQHRIRHYSVDDSVMNRQRNRKKTISTTKNDFDAYFDEENDDLDDDQSIDETNTTLEFDMDSNSLADKDSEHIRTPIDDEESRDLVINEDEDETNKLFKEESIDIETLSDKSNSQLSGEHSIGTYDQNVNLSNEPKNQSQIIIKTPSSTSSEMNMIKPVSNKQSSSFINGIFSKTTNMEYASLIPNVRNLNLKTTIQESTSPNSAFNMNIKQIRLNPSLYQKQKQTNVKPNQ